MISKEELKRIELLFSDFQMLNSVIGTSGYSLIFPNNLEIRINYKRFRKIYFVKMLKVEEVLSAGIEAKRQKDIYEFISLLPNDAQELILLNQGLITKHLYPEVMYFYLSNRESVSVEITL